MMFYPEELIEEIRYHNDIIEIVSQYVKLNKKGNSHFGLCPFHNEKTPSFSVSQEKQMYYCFGCGAGGNVITFVMEYENYSFVEALKYLSERVNISLPKAEISDEMRKEIQHKDTLLEINKEAARYFYYLLNSELGKRALKYLVDRGVKEDIRKKFGVGYAHFFRDDLYKFLKSKNYSDKNLLDSGLIIEEKGKTGVMYDRFFNRIIFPIFDVHNRVIGFGGRALGDTMPKYLNSPETKLFDKSKNLYGLNIARTSRKNYIILVEGYMDVISLHQAGIDNAVASLGTAFTKNQGILLKRYTDEVIIAYDNDTAGKNATLKAISILEEANISVRVLNISPYKDPDDFIKNEGVETFESLINDSLSSFMFEIEQLEVKYNLSDPEHKTKFYHEIAKELVMIDNEIKRENYFEAIIKKYKINQKALKNEMNKIGKEAGIIKHNKDIKDNEKVKNRLSKDSIVIAQKNILTFIASHKDVYEAISPYISPSEFIDEIYKKAAEIIFKLYQDNLELEPAIIINKFIELDEQNKIAHIFNNDIKIENEIQFEKIINESVQIIKNAYIDKMSAQIEEIKDLQDLIKRKRDLQDLYISLNHG